MPWYLIKKILKSEYKVLILYCLNTVLLILLFNQMLSVNYILYPLVLSGAFLLFYFVILYIGYWKIYNNMKNNKIANYAATYEKDFKDEMYLEVIEELHFEYNRRLNYLIEKNQNNKNLFSQFIHNMKTSVSVIDIASSFAMDGISRTNSREEVPRVILGDIQNENRKLKEQLEQALNILRLDQFSLDYVPEKHDLLEIVQKVVNENKTNFIYNGIYPKVIGDSVIVMTDKKWLTYILNQVLSNSIKYSKPEGVVSFQIFAAEDMVTLKVIDTGIGIPEKDMERIFELFYTGSNGRENLQATGIGLAMVKSVAQLLNHKINLVSEEGKGTTFAITFLTKM